MTHACTHWLFQVSTDNKNSKSNTWSYIEAYAYENVSMYRYNNRKINRIR